MKKRLRTLVFGYRLLLLSTTIASVLSVNAQIADYGKSYFNVSKGANGGTIEPGDTLEIRASFVVRNSGYFDSCAFFDAVPGGTVYIPGTIRVLTNEGKIYKQFTDAQYGPNPDEGWIAGPNIRINLGFNQTDVPATVSRRGRVRNTHKPSFYGNSCIMMASYRVRVLAAYGTTINVGNGSFTYKPATGSVTTIWLPATYVRIYQNFGMCANTVGANSIGTEFNGTFGSGRPRNRAASANVPPSYSYQIFNTGTPNDYTYGIPNNTSTRANYTTSDAWPKPDPSSPTHRVFQVWDIIGDHTNAIDPIQGNPAADTVANANGGYMLVVNASYRIDSAFQQTISGLCPDTYYEISCWMRNICSKCGCDSNGKGATNMSGPVYYIPTAPGDSSGVYPSIIFEIDGVGYYTTGQLKYSGTWVKKGFTFKTGPGQTSFTLKYKNNAPGGGGNDWALDDISVATCTPNMSFSPSNLPFLCENNVAELSGVVRSYFNNYTYYKWQRSTNGGATWTDATLPAGPALPVWNGSEWEYTVTYPTFIVTLADSGHQYRLLVATSLANLNNPSCRFTDATNVITLNVNECYTVNNPKILSFTGSLINRKSHLNWISSKEDFPILYEIERSRNGTAFSIIGSVRGHHDPGRETNAYSFIDQDAMNGVTWYRIRVRNLTTNEITYSRIIQLTAMNSGMIVQGLVNPVDDILRFNLVVEENNIVQASIFDQSGREVMNREIVTSKGINPITISETNKLPPGFYTLRLKNENEIVAVKLVKK